MSGQTVVSICKIRQLALAIIALASCKTAVGDLGHHPVEVSAPYNTCTALMRTVLTYTALECSVTVFLEAI